jgi:RNA polymerase sigma-70 factor (ECF subfamily)
MQVPTELESVLDEVSRGNRDAFQWIVRAYSLPLRSFIASHVHHLDEIDDLSQEVLITAYRNLHAFRKDEDFGAWLRGIARNKLHTHFRSLSRRNRAHKQFLEALAREVEADLERAVSANDSGAIELLLGCIGRLPEKLRRVVRAGLDGAKPEALARELLTSVGAVYNLHYRANRLLRACLQKALS